MLKHGYGVRKIMDVGVGRTECERQIALHFGLIAQIGFHSLGSFVENFPEQRGVATARHRRTGGGKCVLEELSNLLAANRFLSCLHETDRCQRQAGDQCQGNRHAGEAPLICFAE